MKQKDKGTLPREAAPLQGEELFKNKFPHSGCVVIASIKLKSFVDSKI